MTWIAHSRLIAFLAGAYAAYCAGIGEYDGAVTILMVYAITYWNYGRKQKSTGAGDTDAYNSTTRRL